MAGIEYLRDAVSVGDLLINSCEHWGDKVSHRVPDGESFREVTFRQLLRQAVQFAGALRDLDLVTGDVVNIFAENSFDWALADWGAQLIGVIMVPIYPTLPSDQASYIVSDSEAKVVLCGNENLRAKVTASESVRIMLVEELADQAAQKPTDVEPFRALAHNVDPGGLATIIYTSGTTGNPKGAMLTHRGILDILYGIRVWIDLNERDTFFGFLPLSHVLERIDGHYLPTAIGATVVYARNLATIAADLPRVNTTIMLTVPRFLEAMRARILDNVAKQKPHEQKLFQLALAQGTLKMQGKFAPLHPMLDRLVGKKVRARLGDQFRFFVSGGAALPAQVAEFFGAFGIVVLQGYGLTETSSGICLNQPHDNDYRTIGHPIQSVEMKIADDGEILIRATCVMKGYLGLPEDTAIAIDSEGWFHSGDIGVKLPDGRYQITDRKKDILVLGNGKNVSPQPIENLLRESVFIREAVLFGDGMEYVCGLVIPDFERLQAHLLKLGLKVSDDATMLEMEPVKKLIKAEVDAVNKKLPDFSKVKKFTILNAQFSVETGELTPSLKVKRRVIRERYADQIQSMSRGGN